MQTRMEPEKRAGASARAVAGCRLPVLFAAHACESWARARRDCCRLSEARGGAAAVVSAPCKRAGSQAPGPPNRASCPIALCNSDPHRRQPAREHRQRLARAPSLSLWLGTAHPPDETARLQQSRCQHGAASVANPFACRCAATALPPPTVELPLPLLPCCSVY